MSGCCSRSVAAIFTARVVVPTPPLLPCRLRMIPCFTTLSFIFATSCIKFFLKSNRALVMSASTAGNCITSFTPARRALSNISVSRLAVARKIYLAACKATMESIRENTSERSLSETCRIIRSHGVLSPGALMTYSGIEEIIRHKSCLSMSSLKSKATVILSIFIRRRFYPFQLRILFTLHYCCCA